ncbi:MAG: hypothetical protein WDM81_04130 [Rhizomicrobium sp.]
MYGKDHLPSQPLYDEICRIAGARPPEHFVFELFLDEKGQKIAKSKGNGLTIDEWLTYAPRESLALYMFQKPRVAKRLSFDVIPKAVDDYIDLLEKYHSNETSEAERLENPVWHIHNGHPPAERYPVSFALLLTLVTASNAHNHEVLWGFIRAYAPQASPEVNPGLAHLADFAIRYYEDFVKPTKQYRAPTEKERAAMTELAVRFDAIAGERDGARVQDVVYEIGKAYQFEPLRDWFKGLYEVLFGQSAGPRIRLLRRPVRLRRDGGPDPPRIGGGVLEGGMKRLVFALLVLVALPASAVRAAPTPWDLYGRRALCRGDKGRHRRRDGTGLSHRRPRRARRRDDAAGALHRLPAPRRSAGAQGDRRRSQARRCPCLSRRGDGLRSAGCRPGLGARAQLSRPRQGGARRGAGAGCEKSLGARGARRLECGDRAHRRRLSRELALRRDDGQRAGRFRRGVQGGAGQSLGALSICAVARRLRCRPLQP